MLPSGDSSEKGPPDRQVPFPRGWPWLHAWPILGMPLYPDGFPFLIIEALSYCPCFYCNTHRSTAAQCDGSELLQNLQCPSQVSLKFPGRTTIRTATDLSLLNNLSRSFWTMSIWAGRQLPSHSLVIPVVGEFPIWGLISCWISTRQQAVKFLLLIPCIPLQEKSPRWLRGHKMQLLRLRSQQWALESHIQLPTRPHVRYCQSTHPEGPL